MQKIVLCDIDGCLIDSSYRVNTFLLKGDHENYRSHMHTDKVIEAGALIYGALHDAGLRLVWVTARMDRPEYREATKGQIIQALDIKKVDDHDLIMRQVGAGVSDVDYKVSVAKSLMAKSLMSSEPAPKIVLAFDDRPNIVAAYRSLGLVAYHTAEGY